MGKCDTKASISGRVKDDASKALLKKQLGDLCPSGPTLDLKTGIIKSKKVKKEKTPEDKASQELKTLEKKTLDFVFLVVLFLHQLVYDMDWYTVGENISAGSCMRT